MMIVAVIVGILGILIILMDAFETIVLPRRVVRKLRFAKIFYRFTWQIWSFIGRRMREGSRREYYLSFYGPLSLLLLMITWAGIFIVAFALIHWGLQLPIASPNLSYSFGRYLYFSGTTFVTLGLGDIIPLSTVGRFLTVLEGGTGLGFLALVIGYVPVTYQTFSRREINVTLLDARAGSPPSGSELLIRHYNGQNSDELIRFLREWERWCAELLESHLSYPVIAYYRSPHQGQSWLAALTMLLDACALIMLGIDGIPIKPTKFIFAIARHATVDIAQSFGVKRVHKERTFTSADFLQLRSELASHGIIIRGEPELAETRFKELRNMYEPFLLAMAQHFQLEISPLEIIPNRVDDWQTSAWDHFLPAAPHTLDRTMRRG